jgi:hypothetical protein
MMDDDDALKCPRCGGLNLHHEKVTTFERGEDAETTTKTEVVGRDTNTAVVPSEGCGNPSLRRHGLVIGFWCETCDAKPQLNLEQHKGTTYVTWAGRRPAAQLNPRVEAAE